MRNLEKGAPRYTNGKIFERLSEKDYECVCMIPYNEIPETAKGKIQYPCDFWYNKDFNRLIAVWTSKKKEGIVTSFIGEKYDFTEEEVNEILN